MPSIQTYSNFADVALAAYGQNLSTNVPNVEKYRADGMARPQAGKQLENNWGQTPNNNFTSVAAYTRTYWLKHRFDTLKRLK